MNNYLKESAWLLFKKMFGSMIMACVAEYHKKPIIRGNKENLKLGKNVIIRSDVEFECHGGIIEIGDDSVILQDVKILCSGGNITIGKNVSINPFCILYGHGNLTIGDNVRIANSSVFIPSNHNFNRVDLPIWQQGETSKGIKLEDDIWIGSNVKVLDGVSISKGIIIGAGSVVTKTLDKEFGIYAGVPAKFIKYRHE